MMMGAHEWVAITGLDICEKGFRAVLLQLKSVCYCWKMCGIDAGEDFVMRKAHYGGI